VNFPRINTKFLRIYCTNCNPKREFRSPDGYRTHLSEYHGAKPADRVQWRAVGDGEFDVEHKAGSGDDLDNAGVPVPQK
jgi:hypothetical protein